MTPLVILEWFLTPIGKYVGIGLVGLSIVAVIFGKGVVWEHKRVTQEIQMESKNAITKSDAARVAAVKRFDAGRMRNDGFARD